MSIDSNYCKTALIAYFRFKGSFKYIATECGRYFSDVLVIKKKKLIEIEIKVSKSDFKNDFKKPKHEDYNKPLNQLINEHKAKFGNNHYSLEGLKYDSFFIPNQFYFAVPSNLVNFCLKYINDNCPQYGLLEIMDSTTQWPDRVKVVKRAKTLHKREVNNYVKASIVGRMSSELARLYIRMSK